MAQTLQRLLFSYVERTCGLKRVQPLSLLLIVVRHLAVCNIPSEHIIGTIVRRAEWKVMSVKPHATIEELYDIPGKAELVNGEIIRMTPTGARPGNAAFEIAASLRQYARRTGRGRAVPDNVGFRVDLPRRQSFSPDAAYFVGEDPGMRFYEGAPLFAAEVRSEGDYGPAAEQAIAEKRADYFAAGTLVVWDVDLLSADIVRVYRVDAPHQPTIYRLGDYAEAEPAVPGWSMPVMDDLFS